MRKFAPSKISRYTVIEQDHSVGSNTASVELDLCSAGLAQLQLNGQQ